ncbi:hypothetical protein HNR39_002914 [Glaciimonas immobilis]|uniref:Uncharacterized protein n=1 Tax=Glaciimonas immobilis TaxID=728004 RepID=A0A840RTB3_9BURK|nr:hypothetical protein [Glaciimonas immobilis]
MISITYYAIPYFMENGFFITIFSRNSKFEIVRKTACACAQSDPIRSTILSVGDGVKKVFSMMKINL